MVIKTKCRFPKLCKYPHTEDGECDKFCSFNTKEIKTNADRIRSMTDEELAKALIAPLGYCETAKECKPKCVDCLLEWLKKEVDDGR